VESLSQQSKVDFSVIIATRNRKQLLENVLSDIAQNSMIPFLVIVIDSSDEYERNTNNYPFHLIHLFTDQKSAAIQRNIAIEILGERDSYGEFVTILDDDVRIKEDFFRSIIETFKDYPAAIGVSGMTEESAQVKSYRLLRNLIGLSGKPGQLTRASVNISPAGIENCRSVDWLIGCSSWRSEIFRMIKYEVDFQGQSLFEDVIFSARARKYGLLVVNPRTL
jgi:glycosyltransferase involved in cell wall biosynthesis